MKLDGYYINLESAKHRRLSVEKNVAEVHFSDRISMKRFPGIIPSQSQAAEFHTYLPGFPAGHVGCMLSHKAVLEHKIALNDNESDLLVCEDDVLFSPRTEALLAPILDYLADKDWDLLYTDFIVEGESQKCEFYANRMKRKNDLPIIINLGKVDFNGLTSYIVNRKSLTKFLSIYEMLHPMNKLVDWHIGECVHKGLLNALAVFPFLTSINTEADHSVIDAGTTISLSYYNNFIRRHLWIDGPQCF